MADSNITKHALANALREIMMEVPFEKIQVTHICERCGMNRKSFYYHFRDKYDLLNWIFDTEITVYVQNFSDDDKIVQRIEELQKICLYFYENRSFYSRALMVKGQNSFPEHFREYIRPILKIRLSNIIDDIDDFALDFFTDAVVCSFERWMLDKNCMPPDEFISKMLKLIYQGTNNLYEEIKKEF